MKNAKNFDSIQRVIAVVAFSQGVLSLSDFAVSFMLKDNYHMQPSEMTYVQGLISFPWVIKPIWGLCSDMFPICGFRRKSYLFIFGVLQFLLWNILALYGMQDILIGVSTLIAIQISVSFCNVVGEALLVQASSDDDSHATKNVSFFFGVKASGTLLTAYFSGYLLKFLEKQQIFQITSIFPLIMAIVALQLQEEKIIITERAINHHRNQINKTQSLKELMSFLNKPQIYQPILFIFVFMMAPSQSTAMFYFYTTQLGFTAEFLGKLKFFQACGNIFSIVLFNKKLKNIPFRTIFAYSTFAYFLCSALTLILVTRENTRLGLPDKPFCLADTILIHIVGELNTLPILILACKICPPNIEGRSCVCIILGTMYALLMSTINLGQLLGKQVGGILMHTLGISDSSFTNLWILVLIHTCYILVPLPFLFTVKEDEMMKIKEEAQITPNSSQDFVDRFSSSNERLTLSSIENEQTNSTNRDELQNLLDEL